MVILKNEIIYSFIIIQNDVNHVIWHKVFKSGTSKICGRQPLKHLKGYGLLKHFTWSTLEYFVSYIIVYHYILSDIISKKQRLLLKQRIPYFAETQAVQKMTFVRS